MVAVVTLPDGTVVSEQHERGGSNNIAELMAVEAAYRFASDQGMREVTVYTDSRNNLSWASLKPPGKAINDRGKVLTLQSQIAFWRERLRPRLVWIPRDDNVAGWYIESTYQL